MYCGEEVVVVLDVGRKSLDKWLEIVIKEGGNSFSGRANIGNDGSAGITRFMDSGKLVKFKDSGIVMTECRDSGTRQPFMGSMHFLVGANLIKEGLRGIILEGTVKCRIGKLSEGFALVVRVIHDYRGGSLVNRPDNNSWMRTKIGDSSSFCSREVVMRLERVSEARVSNLCGKEG